MFQEFTIENLATYTQYLVSLRVYNPEGNGPETIVVVMTDEGGKLIINFYDINLPITITYETIHFKI